MLHPSYTELMEKINSEVEEGEQPLVQSRYSIVKATAARAKQIIDARHIQEQLDKNADKEKPGYLSISREDLKKLKVGTPLVNDGNRKPLSIAVDELYAGVVKIVGNKDTDED